MEPENIPPAFEWTPTFDELAEPVFIHDEEFRILRCNAAYAACAGQPMKAIVGQAYWQVFPKGDRPPMPESSGVSEFTTEDGRVFLTHDITVHKPSGEFWYSRHLLLDISSRRRLEKALAREKEISDAIIESAPAAFFLADEKGDLVRWNGYVRNESGLADEELRGMPAAALVYEEDRPLAAAKLLTALATGMARMEVRVVHRGKGVCVFLTTARRVVIDGVPHVASFCVDITERKQAETALAENKQFADVLIESMPGVFYVVDAEGNYFRWNSYLNRLTGLADADLSGRGSLLTVEEDDRQQAATMIKDALETGYAKATLRLRTNDRGARPFIMTARRFSVGAAGYLAMVGVDASDEVAAIKALEQEVRTDPLTHVLSRSRFMERAAGDFARSRRYRRGLSVWMLDIDSFKSVNDTHGHEAGDEVLRAVVDIARDTLRDWDVLGRVGGEEFAVLLPETEIRQAQLVAERLRQNVRDAEVQLGEGRTVRVTISIGIAAVLADDADIHAALRRADEALYEAKRTGRDKVCLAQAVPAAA